jgi:hypothetical protein
MVDLDSLTIGQARILANLVKGQDPQSDPYDVGKAYFIRTVTHYFIGQLVAVHPMEIVLEHAVWVADTGSRLTQFLRDGELNDNTEIEVCPSGPVVIGRNAVIDAIQWPHDIPNEQR